jgi:hypothetical protein
VVASPGATVVSHRGDVGEGVDGALVVTAVVGTLGRTVVVSDLLLGGKRRRYLVGGPGRLRRLELGQLCSAHSERERGLVVRSQLFRGANTHVTDLERTAPPHDTGHWRRTRIGGESYGR